MADGPNPPDFEAFFRNKSNHYEEIEITSDEALQLINGLDHNDEIAGKIVDAISDINARIRTEPGYVIICVRPA